MIARSLLRTVLLSALAAALTPGAGEHLAASTAQPSRSSTSSGWSITRPSNGRQIEGYAAVTSAQPGDEVPFFVSTTAPSYTAEIYRMGWYQGQGGLLVQTLPSVRGQEQAVPTASPDTGLIDSGWTRSFTLSVPADWSSGVYLVKLVSSAGYQAYVPLVVRPAAPTARILLVHAVATDEAYNSWGGNSLYVGKTPKLGLSRAVEVSYNRPFAQAYGSGLFLVWEYPMIRWLEQNGYRVDYATDVDVHLHPQLLRDYKAIVVVGHDEYWSRAMREAYADAVAHGVNVAVFAGNTAFRQVRFTPDQTGAAARIMICYKPPPTNDPLYGVDNALVTTNWRAKPVNWPESTLLGAMYGSDGSHNPRDLFDWVVRASGSWVYGGTGLKDGDKIAGVVGNEWDEVVAGYPKPPNLVMLSRSPTLGEGGFRDLAEATIYTAPSGAQIFNASSIDWSWGLDNFSPPRSHSHDVENADSKIITQNILNRFAALSTAAGRPTAEAASRWVFLPVGIAAVAVLMAGAYGLRRGLRRRRSAPRVGTP